MNNNQETFPVGSIVDYKGGYYRVSRSTRETVNLRGVWGSRRTLHKSVSKSEITEAANEFMAYWQTTESYMCM
jgi:hypothetical protein